MARLSLKRSASFSVALLALSLIFGGLSPPSAAQSDTPPSVEDPYIAAKRAAAETLNKPRPGEPARARDVAVSAATTYPITIRLSWNGQVDLDLYTVTPGGQEIYYGRTSDTTTQGRLRWDLIPSSTCTSTYRDEYIDFAAPTSGTYIVRVNFYSSRTCASYPINWTVEASYNGRVDRASGSYTSSSQAIAAGSGGGTQVLSFTYSGSSTQTVSFTPVTSCTGDYTYSVPHLSTELDGTTASSIYTSVIATANHNRTSNATVMACGYTNDGSLIGGTSYTLPPGYRVFALNPASSGQTSLQTLFNTTSLPSLTSFHGVIKSSIPLVVEGGFVGNNSQFFLFQSAASTGTVLGQAHMGNLSAYPGIVYLANVSNVSTSASLDFYNDTGQVAATTQSTLIPAYGRIKLSLGSLLDPSGNAITISDYYSMRVRGSESSAPIGGWAATIVPVGSTATVSVAPLQVVE